MPECIQIGGNQIDYVYNASGVKQSVKYIPVSGNPVTRTYSGNKVYENGNLKMILTEEGYVEKEGNSFNHYYCLKDHLGNNRVVLDASGNIIQSTEYYPFGAHYTKSTSQEKQPYKFGGKELDHLFDLDCYDFEARMYDPVLGRFMTMDPLAEKYYSISPYVYCNNNPVNAVDPTGMDYYLLTQEGKLVLALKNDDKTDMLFGNSVIDNKFNSLEVKDKSILGGLYDNQTAENGTSIITSNGNEAFNVFKFAADNSNVEWSLSGFNDNNKTEFYLNTNRDVSGADTGRGSVFQDKDFIFNVHNHPGKDGTKGGSGYNDSRDGFVSFGKEDISFVYSVFGN